MASYRAACLLNDALAKRGLSERCYAVNGDNDLCSVLITPAVQRRSQPQPGMNRPAGLTRLPAIIQTTAGPSAWRGGRGELGHAPAPRARSSRCPSSGPASADHHRKQPRGDHHLVVHDVGGQLVDDALRIAAEEIVRRAHEADAEIAQRSAAVRPRPAPVRSRPCPPARISV